MIKIFLMKVHPKFQGIFWSCTAMAFINHILSAEILLYCIHMWNHVIVADILRNYPRHFRVSKLLHLLNNTNFTKSWSKFSESSCKIPRRILIMHRNGIYQPHSICRNIIVLHTHLEPCHRSQHVPIQGTSGFPNSYIC